MEALQNELSSKVPLPGPRTPNRASPLMRKVDFDHQPTLTMRHELRLLYLTCPWSVPGSVWQRTLGVDIVAGHEPPAEDIRSPEAMRLLGKPRVAVPRATELRRKNFGE